MALIQELVEIKRLIDKGEELLAKARLLEFLDLNPDSADGWWLVSLITGSDEDRKTVLERVLRLDPTHHDARRALERLLPQPAPAPPKRKVAPTAVQDSEGMPQIMSGAVLAYLQKGYSVTKVGPTRTILEKTTGLSWWLAITIMALTGGLGAIVLFANFFMRRRHRIILDVMPNNRVAISGSVKRQILDVRAVSRGDVPVPSTNILMAFVYGTLSAVVVCGALVGVLVYIGLQEPDLAVGDRAYVVGETGQRCIETHLLPGASLTGFTQIAVGTEVEIAEVDDTYDEPWYRVELNGVMQGWLPENNLSDESPALSVGLNACQ